MLLSIWLIEHNLSAGEFGLKAGISRAHVSALASGAKWPSRATARKIKIATSDGVSADDFLDLIPKS